MALDAHLPPPEHEACLVDDRIGLCLCLVDLLDHTNLVMNNLDEQDAVDEGAGVNEYIYGLSGHVLQVAAYVNRRVEPGDNLPLGRSGKTEDSLLVPVFRIVVFQFLYPVVRLALWIDMPVGERRYRERLHALVVVAQPGCEPCMKPTVVGLK